MYQLLSALVAQIRSYLEKYDNSNHFKIKKTIYIFNKKLLFGMNDRMLERAASICSILSFVVIVGSILVTFVIGANLEIHAFSYDPIIATSGKSKNITFYLYNNGNRPAFVHFMVLQDAETSMEMGISRLP